MADLGANEVAEGLSRLSASYGFTACSEQMAESSTELTALGMAQVAEAQALGEVIQVITDEGIAQDVEGASQMGEASGKLAATITLDRKKIIDLILRYTGLIRHSTVYLHYISSK